MYVIIDGSSIAYRSYHAAPISGFKNIPDNKEEVERVAGLFLYSLCSQLIKIIRRIDATKPAFSKVLICWDTRTSSKLRRELYPQYKVSRDKHRDKREHITPHTFINIAKEELSYVSKRFSLSDEYAEADDLIAVVCKLLGDKKKTVVTRDRDMFQLVDEHSKVFDPFNEQFYGIKEVYDSFGCYPKQIIEYKAVIGDPSDNYHGIKGIGPKKGIQLINSTTNYDVTNPEVKIFRKLAKIPFCGYDETAFKNRLRTLKFKEVVDWDYLAKKWEFNHTLKHNLHIVT